MGKRTFKIIVDVDKNKKEASDEIVLEKIKSLCVGSSVYSSDACVSIIEVKKN